MRAAGFSGAKEQRFACKDGAKCLQGQWSSSAYKKLKPQSSDDTAKRYFAFQLSPEPCVHASPHGVEPPVQSREREGILCAENTTTFTEQSYI